MFFKKREKEIRRPGDAAAYWNLAPAEDAAAVMITDIRDLEGVEGGEPLGRSAEGAYYVEMHQGGRSKRALPASPGDVFVVEATVTLERAAANGRSTGFLAGPIFLDDAGNVVKWWPLNDAPTGAVTALSIRAVAPEGATSVRLGLYGAYHPDGETADYVISYRSARMHKLAP